MPKISVQQKPVKPPALEMGSKDKYYTYTVIILHKSPIFNIRLSQKCVDLFGHIYKSRVRIAKIKGSRQVNPPSKAT